MNKKSASLGIDTSQVKVTNISPHGLWLLLHNEELFLPFSGFSWFRDANIAKIFNVELPSPNHLYWSDLDIDIPKLVHVPVGVQETHISKPESLAMMAKLSETLISPIIDVLIIPIPINIAIINLQESDSLPNHYSFSGK